MMDLFTLALVAWLILPILLLVFWLRAKKRAKLSEIEINTIRVKLAQCEKRSNELGEKLAPITSIEREVGKKEEEKVYFEKEITSLKSSYKEKRELMDQLEEQLAIYDESLSMAKLGIYEPHFDFGVSEVYKEQIKEVRQQQKDLVAAKAATIAPSGWTVDGSLAKGKTMLNRQTRLTMRAFNNECEAAIANARWNNAVAMEKRIMNAAKQIDSANSSLGLIIADEYVDLRLDELHLTHEYKEQLKIERDERSELARAEREEKKLLAQAEAAEKEERKYQTLLDKARKDVGIEDSKIAELEAALAEAQSNGERARAMAEMTKSGYVYVISNIGSFGEDVVKIGLTRRLEPDDRVKELGDASVPFGFDTHAMIYSEEAPALEAALHKEFSDKRVNAANMRKEFFRVGLEEVEEAVSRLAPTANFFKDREAQDWYETLARRNEKLTAMAAGGVSFPDSI